MYLIDTQRRRVESDFYGNDLAKVLPLWFAVICSPISNNSYECKYSCFRADYQIYLLKDAFIALLNVRIETYPKRYHRHPCRQDYGSDTVSFYPFINPSSCLVCSVPIKSAVHLSSNHCRSELRQPFADTAQPEKQFHRQALPAGQCP